MRKGRQSIEFSTTLIYGLILASVLISVVLAIISGVSIQELVCRLSTPITNLSGGFNAC